MGRHYYKLEGQLKRDVCERKCPRKARIGGNYSFSRVFTIYQNSKYKTEGENAKSVGCLAS